MHSSLKKYFYMIMFILSGPCLQVIGQMYNILFYLATCIEVEFIYLTLVTIQFHEIFCKSLKIILIII